MTGKYCHSRWGRRSRSRGRRTTRCRSKSKPRRRIKSASPPKSPSSLFCPNHGPLPETLLEHVVDFDMRFSGWVHEQGLGLFFYVFLRMLEFSGDDLFLIPAAAAAFLAPKHKLTPELRMFFFNLFGAFMLDLVFVSVIKNYVRRPRPAYNHGHFITMNVDHWSFPSGHSTRALMVVTFFTMYLPMWKDQSSRVWLPFLMDLCNSKVVMLDEAVPIFEDLLVSIVAWVVFSWAVATTTSRIILGRHFFFDVLVGSAVGILESVLYHSFFFIPCEVSELIHQYVNGFFASVEYTFWRVFRSTSFYIEDQKSR